MRDFLAKELPASSFEPRELASPSAGLTYKMLQVPPSFDVTNKTDGSRFTTRSRDAYTVPSRSTKPNTRRLRLGLLPSRDPELPRTANVIRPATHEIWRCATGAEVREFLRSEFPQLPDAVVFCSPVAGGVQGRARAPGFLSTQLLPLPAPCTSHAPQPSGAAADDGKLAHAAQHAGPSRPGIRASASVT